MTQDELKQAVAQAAADYVAQHAPEGSIIGVGTGSTANFFIDALAPLKGRYKGMDEAFIKNRLEKFLMLIPFAYRMAEPITKSPKGFAGIIERDPKGEASAKKKETTNHENQ